MKLVVRVAASLLGAGTFYSAWLAVVLALDPQPTAPLPLVVSATAPLFTALGFALGALLADRLTRQTQTRFLRTYLWPLAGCVVGALVVYPFGPMLIVFGMFALGTVTVFVEGLMLEERAHLDNKRIQQIRQVGSQTRRSR